MTYEERLSAYEREKHQMVCKDQKDYEKQIKELIKKYKI